MSILSNATAGDKSSASETLRKLKESVGLLERSEKKQPLYNKLMGITLNNLACYYKRYLERLK